MVVSERFELSVGKPTQPFQGCTIGHSDTKPNFKAKLYNRILISLFLKPKKFRISIVNIM